MIKTLFRPKFIILVGLFFALVMAAVSITHAQPIEQDRSLKMSRYYWDVFGYKIHHPQPRPTRKSPQVSGILFIVFGGVAFGAVAVGGKQWQRSRPRFTPEEVELKREKAELEKEQKRRLKEIKLFAREYRKKVIDSLAVSGYRYVYARQGATRLADKVKLGPIILTDDAVYYHVAKRPQNTLLSDLLKPEIEHELNLDLRRECKVIETEDLGVWIRVSLKTGFAAIPRVFDWDDRVNDQVAYKMLPKTNPFSIALGMTENRYFVHIDLRDLPHLLVAGATDGGKSVFLNQLVCTLITRNSPDRLKLLMIDLKGGLEFSDYDGIPHLLHNEIIIDKDKVKKKLDWIMAEKERRFEKMRGRARKLSVWNALPGVQKMPYIIVVFDEIAALMLDRDLKDSIETLVTNLSEQGRAVGIHLVLCTQMPKSEVISTRITANIVSRVIFASSAIGSRVVLDGLESAKMLPAKTGRMLYKRGMSMTECQAPFISDQQITEAIAQAKGEQAEETEIQPYDLFHHSVNKMEGLFTIREIFNEFKHRTAKNKIELISSEYEFNYEQAGPVIDLENGAFILARVKDGKVRKRMLVPVDEQFLPVSQDDLDMMITRPDAWKQARQEAQLTVGIGEPLERVNVSHVSRPRRTGESE